MAKIVVGNLFRKPATLMYPVKPAKITPISRGHVVMSDMDSCIYCGLCSRRCPAQAIEVDKEARTWQIDRMRCIVCNSCVEICPKSCLSMDTQYIPAIGGSETIIEKIQGPPAEPKEKKEEE